MKVFIISTFSLLFTLTTFASEYSGKDQLNNDCSLTLISWDQNLDGTFKVKVETSAERGAFIIVSPIQEAEEFYLYGFETLGIPMFSKVRMFTLYIGNGFIPVGYTYSLATDGFNRKVIKEVDCRF